MFGKYNGFVSKARVSACMYFLVINRSNPAMLLVQLGINSTRDVWKFCQIGLGPADRPILAKFPNITRTINP